MFDARVAKRFDEAICLAQRSINATDKTLAGASHFEVSHAWDGLGCHDKAVAAIEASVRVRPSDKDGWRETCARCSTLKADCAPCNQTVTDRIPCPSLEQLTARLAPIIGLYAPNEGTWAEPKVEMCTPIGLPEPGWYVIGSLHQEAPDYYYTFPMAVEAQSYAPVAFGPGVARKYNHFCNLTFGKTTEKSDSPSELSMREECHDKFGTQISATSFTATIKPPKIVFRQK